MYYEKKNTYYEQKNKYLKVEYLIVLENDM